MRPKFTIDNLLSRLYAIAEGVEGKPMYWLNPDDTGESYCRECIEKIAKDEDQIDGGWSIECDSQEFCGECGEPLLCSFTNHGVQEEVHAICEADGDIGPTDAWIMTRIIDCGVPRLTERCGDFEYAPELRPLLRRLWHRLRRQEAAKAKAPEAPAP